MPKSKSKRPARGKDGLFHAQKYIGRYPDGTRCYERFSNKSWDALLLDVAARRQEFAAGIEALPKEQPQTKHSEPVMTLVVAMDKYIETCRTLCDVSEDYSPATIASYVSIRNSVDKHPAFAEVAHCPIEHVTVDKLQSAINQAIKPDANGKQLSTKTINNWYGVIKPALDTYGPDIRLDKVKRARGKAEKTMIIKESMIPLVFRIALEIDRDFFLYVLFTAVLGARPSESYALTWGDISAEKMVAIQDGVKYDCGEVFIDKAKVRDEFNKYREKGPKTKAGERALSRHWAFFETLYSVKPRGKDDERIFDLKPNLAPYRWKKLKKQIDLPEGMVMYDLRHYHASAMAACGAQARYIADDMGHSDIAITQKHYIEELHEKRQEINAAMYERTESLLRAFAK